MKKTNFIAYIEKDEDGIFIGSIPSVLNCHAQGETREELMSNLKEVLVLCLRNLDSDSVRGTSFIGMEQFEMTYA